MPIFYQKFGEKRDVESNTKNKIIVQQMSTTAKYNQRVYRNSVKNNRKIFDIPIILSSQ